MDDIDRFIGQRELFCGAGVRVELQDMFTMTDVLLAELQELHRFPRTTTLILFGNDLSEDQLDSVPLHDLKELAKIDLAQNRLCRLPDALARSPSLQYLSLWQNHDLYFTADEVDWPALRYLDVRQTSVPEETLARLAERHPDAVLLR